MLCHANPNDSELDRCIECGREHEQLAEWLQELKLYREIGTLEEVKDALARKTDCPYNDMAEKQKSATEKLKEAQEINRKNGVDVKKLVKLRIRAQLNLVEAAEIAGVRTAQYSAWERERELFPVDKYNELLKRFKQEISNQKCGNCQFYNGDESDIESFCDKLEDETQRDCVCERYMKRWE